MEKVMHPEMNNTTMSDGSMHMSREVMMSHMTFYWGKNTEIFISGWPGQSLSMYLVALIFIFMLSMLVEFLSHTRLIKPGTNHIIAGVLQTVLYAIRAGLAFLVMLAVMSFNIGILLVVMAGYTVGFLLFGSQVFKKPDMMLYDHQKLTDLPPLNC